LVQKHFFLSRVGKRLVDIGLVFVFLLSELPMDLAALFEKGCIRFKLVIIELRAALELLDSAFILKMIC
jgi:hypothetical protein